MAAAALPLLASVHGPVAWQPTVATGTRLGGHRGRGRSPWAVFVLRIIAVAAPTVPVLCVTVVVVGALLLAHFVAAVPDHIAARTATAALLGPGAGPAVSSGTMSR